MCPFNIKFAQELEEPSFAPRAAIVGKDARTLARDLLQMTQEEFSRAFKGSPMKRAKLRALRRNAAVVLGNVGASDDMPALATALSDDEPLVRARRPVARPVRVAGLGLVFLFVTAAPAATTGERALLSVSA